MKKIFLVATKKVWTLTAMNANGLTVNWNPDNGQVNLNHNDVGNRDDNLGVRPEMRVTFCVVRAQMDFIHPPNMRPISLHMALD